MTRLTGVGVAGLEVELWTVAVVGAAAVSEAALVLVAVVAAPDGVDVVVSAALAGVSSAVVVRFVGGASGASLLKLPVVGSAGDTGPPCVETAGWWAATVGEGSGGRS